MLPKKDNQIQNKSYKSQLIFFVLDKNRCWREGKGNEKGREEREERKKRKEKGTCKQKGLGGRLEGQRKLTHKWHMLGLQKMDHFLSTDKNDDNDGDENNSDK